ncbi:hypothetical protein Btru_024435 [Bulinus truncatus]|nr:hypothetical protein Btru_024435 [Bulinus truncatus]
MGTYSHLGMRSIPNHYLLLTPHPNPMGHLQQWGPRLPYHQNGSDLGSGGNRQGPTRGRRLKDGSLRTVGKWFRKSSRNWLDREAQALLFVDRGRNIK